MKQKKNKEKLFKEEDWFSYVCGFYARVIAKTRKADKEGKKEEKKKDIVLTGVKGVYYNHTFSHEFTLSPKKKKTERDVNWIHTQV